MKTLLTLLTCLFILSPNVVLSETFNQLESRGGLYYKKFSDVPFSGKVTGHYQGKMKNGRWDGPNVRYWDNGQLEFKGTWKNGKRDGPWFWYQEDGQLSYKGTYKDGKQ